MRKANLERDSDASLARRWRAGDGQAAAAVVERYTDALGAIAYGVTRNRALAEEAVQETFARATRTLGQLKDPARLGPWLVGIVRHVAVDMARRRSRETPIGDRDIAARSNPGHEAMRNEAAESLGGAIAALPEDQRDILAMKYVAGMSYGAIAETLGMTPDAVSQKLWRVRQKLQKELVEFRP
ncbi:MAG TPA: sigma-70 family RNA polymerase sigma factor [Candidatus Hydrogenedentes bacterium]|nr:sigma-70 family RNA polymerase sigma factor [Candidatus Hydrogenedentota bacterium]